MRKIRLLTLMTGSDISGGPGDIVEMSPEVAARYVALGYAEYPVDSEDSDILNATADTTGIEKKIIRTKRR